MQHMMAVNSGMGFSTLGFYPNTAAYQQVLTQDRNDSLPDLNSPNLP